MRHAWFALIAVLLAPFATLHAAEEPKPASRPNIIFILTDDMGWGDAAAWGHPYYKTPNLDRLTRDGKRFTQFYVANPVCSPSRTAFMTGQYPARFSVHGHFAEHATNHTRGMPDWLDPRAMTVTRILHDAGYVTGHFGKWHLGSGVGAPEPGAYGIDRAITQVSNGPQLREPGSPPVPHWWGHSTRIIVDHAITFLRENKDRPIYLNVWTLLPHATLDPTPEQLAVYKDLEPRADNPAFGKWTQEYYRQAKDLRGQMQVFGASITDLDTQIGRLLDAVQELGLADKTLIVFSSDNGPEDYHIGNARNAGVGSPGPLRARKRSLYEGGIHTPLLVRWPGQVPAGVTDETSVIGGVDFLPTVCKLAGAAVPPEVKLDGEDVSDIIKGPSRPRRGPLFWEWRFSVAGNPAFTPPRLAVRDGDWKLLLDPKTSRAELYDIPHDTSEEKNVADAHADVVKRLAQMARDWQATLPKEPPADCIAKEPPGSAKASPSKDRLTLFKGKDTNHDGKLTLEEYLHRFPDQAEGRRRFAAFDTNKDGILSEEEFVKMGQ